MRRFVPLLSLLFSTAAAAEGVLSLDYCADQYVLALTPRHEITALSPAATTAYSYYAGAAAGLPTVRPVSEDVLTTDANIVVRAWGGGFEATRYLGKFGMRGVDIPYADSLDAAGEALVAVGEALGQPEKAAALKAAFDAARSELKARAEGRPTLRALYVTPGGVTTGAGTFVDELMRAGGVVNMAAEGGRAGWFPIDLEALVTDPPDLIVGGFFDLDRNYIDHWSIARHSLFRDLLATRPVVMIPSRYLSCGAWFAVEAAERIADTAYPLQRAEGGSR